MFSMLSCSTSYKALSQAEAVDLTIKFSVIQECIEYGYLSENELVDIIRLGDPKELYVEDSILYIKSDLYKKLLKIHSKCSYKLKHSL